MITTILTFLSTGKMALIVAGAVAGLGIIWRVLAGVKQSGIDKQKAKEAEQRDRNLEAIKRAADARPSGSVLNDPNNRDNP